MSVAGEIPPRLAILALCSVSCPLNQVEIPDGNPSGFQSITVHSGVIVDHFPSQLVPETLEDHGIIASSVSPRYPLPFIPIERWQPRIVVGQDIGIRVEELINARNEKFIGKHLDTPWLW